jgi:cysteine desulfurase
MKRIYLDNAATTPVDPKVTEAMTEFLKLHFGNPSSIHHFGRVTKVMLEETRETLASFIGAKPNEIYFTSGGTEANNMAVKGIAFSFLGKKNHILSSKTEHHSVLDSLEYLRDKFGFEITFLKNDKTGKIDLNHLQDAICNRTFLVCVMHSNNETGVINNIAEISAITNRYGIFFHSDTVQSIGKTNVNVKDLCSDTCTISSHKIYGPKGIGALYIKNGVKPDKFIHGGMQELNMRGGTENTVSIAGFRKTIEILKESMEADINLYRKLNTVLTTGLTKTFTNKIQFNSPEIENSLPNIVNVSFNTSHFKTNSDTLIMKLDMEGIAVSSGSACTSGAVKPSHVLEAMGIEPENAKGSVRISFGRNNTEEDIERLIITMKKILT